MTLQFLQESIAGKFRRLKFLWISNEILDLTFQGYALWCLYYNTHYHVSIVM